MQEIQYIKSNFNYGKKEKEDSNIQLYDGWI